MRRLLAGVFLLALSLPAQVISTTGGVVTGVSAPSGGAPAPAVHTHIDTYTSSGTHTTPVVSLMASLDLLIEAWGAGGGGTTNTGAGGGACYGVETAFTASAETGYAVGVGTGATDTNGGSSTFNTSSLVVPGGLSGTNGSGGCDCAGATADTCFDGATGGIGTGNQSGGAGAGTTEDGDGAPGDGGDDFGGRGDSADNGRDYGAGGRSHAGSGNAGKTGAVRVHWQENVDAEFPVLKAFAASRSTGATNDIPVDMPSGIEAGDLLFAAICSDGSTTISDHTGWTLLATEDETSATGHLLYKTAAGSDTLTFDLSASEPSAHLSFRITGQGGAPTETATTASGTDSDPPSHTHPGGSTKGLWFAIRAGDIGTSTSTTQEVSGAPSGFHGLLVTQWGQAGCSIAVAMDHEEAETVNPGAFANKSDGAAVFTMVVPGT